MIPRYQRVLFVVFLAATILMAVDLFHLRHSTKDRLAADIADAPLVAPSQMQTGTVQLLLANDLDDSLRTVEKNLATPDSANAKARFVLQALFSEYTQPLSQHPLPSGGSVEDVFLLTIENPSMPEGPDGPNRVAVVNLDRGFASTHPSGLATEMLTLRSIVGTLHANLPQIVAVRFLIDGQPADTLAGHADLRHFYSATEEKQIAVDASLDEGAP